METSFVLRRVARQGVCSRWARVLRGVGGFFGTLDSCVDEVASISAPDFTAAECRGYTGPPSGPDVAGGAAPYRWGGVRTGMYVTPSRPWTVLARPWTPGAANSWLPRPLRGRVGDALPVRPQCHLHQPGDHRPRGPDPSGRGLERRAGLGLRHRRRRVELAVRGSRAARATARVRGLASTCTM